MERSLSEKADREKNYLTELHSKRSEMSGELKAMCYKYEAEIKQIQSELEDERERVSEVEAALLQKVTEIESSQERWIS